MRQLPADPRFAWALADDQRQRQRLNLTAPRPTAIMLWLPQPGRLPVRLVEVTGYVDVRIWIAPCSNRGHGDNGQGANDKDDGASSPDLVQENDYRIVKFRGRDFRLGPLQARVVKLLHDAQQRGEPWVYGKTLLHEAGSKGRRVSDLFKAKKDWRQVIDTGRRGFYRLRTV